MFEIVKKLTDVPRVPRDLHDLTDFVYLCFSFGRWKLTPYYRARKKTSSKTGPETKRVPQNRVLSNKTPPTYVYAGALAGGRKGLSGPLYLPSPIRHRQEPQPWAPSFYVWKALCNNLQHCQQSSFVIARFA